MGSSKVTICNKALGLLSSPPIVIFEEDSIGAERCRSQYSITRMAVLEEHNWSFAIRRDIIAPKSKDPIFGYKYKFSKPFDCIRIIKVLDSNDKNIDWFAEGNDILCNSNSIHLIYIFDNKIPQLYSPGFVDAFSTKLAADLAYVVTESPDLYNILINQYNLKIEKAIINDSSQGVSSIKIGISKFIEVR